MDRSKTKYQVFENFWLHCLSPCFRCFKKKLDYKFEKCIFIGYSHKTKGYKLYDLVTIKVVIGQDVILEEIDSWDWLEKQHEKIQNYILLPIVGSRIQETKPPRKEIMSKPSSISLQ